MNPPATANARRLLPGLLLASALVSAFLFAAPGFAPEAQAACNMSPQGKVLVMSDNVYEVQKSDARDPSDMRRFVDRMKEMAPTAPDIVLIQEARKSAVRNIRDFMVKKFGCRFSVPVDASRSAWQWIHKYWKLGGQDTAVIVNENSMAVRSKGYVAHDYNRTYAAKGESVKVKKSAWVKTVERNVGGNAAPLTVVAASVHYPRGSDFAGDATNKRLKKVFSEQLARRLKRKQPDGDRSDKVIHVIGGDMNNNRYEGKASNETPAYAALTHAPWSYNDGVIDLAASGSPNPIDFIFSTGNAARADVDKSSTHNENSPSFYSNHDLRWALLEGPDTTPPTSPGDVDNKQGYGSWTRLWGWNDSRDGGSGFAGYNIYRRRAGDSSWDTIKRGLMDNDYKDYSVVAGALYEYRITAIDNAGNESGSNKTLDIRAGN